MNRLLLLTFLYTFSLIVLGQNKGECSISGTVIDADKKPVPNAYIIFDTPPTGWEDLILSFKSDTNGNFNYTTSCSFLNGKLNLYVASPISFDNYTPFTPPFTRTKKLGKNFVGQLIINPKKRNLDLGKVNIQVYFSDVIVRFVDKYNNPLIKSKEEWKNIWIRLRSGKRIVSQTGLSQNDIEKAVLEDESAITMSLPEGEWLIEVSFDGDKWLKSNKPLIVKKSNNTQEILKMSDTNQL